MKHVFFLCLFFNFLFIHSIFAETIIGAREIRPGIAVTFEVAARDSIFPSQFYLPENETDIHIEMLATWTEDAPDGFPVGGHVAYLAVSAKILNEQSGEFLDFELTPHINLSDSLHYAQNIRLPGNPDNTYEITFTVSPPDGQKLGIHLDWLEVHGETILQKKDFTFTGLSLTGAINSRRER